MKWGPVGSGATVPRWIWVRDGRALLPWGTLVWPNISLPTGAYSGV